MLEECGQKGVRAAVVISAGFKEVGAEGAELERLVLEQARKYGIRVVGPNCVGVLNMDEAYSAINWKTVFLMACLIPLGWALDSTGAANWLAQQTLERRHSTPPKNDPMCR